MKMKQILMLTAAVFLSGILFSADLNTGGKTKAISPESILKKMTLREKIGQLFIVPVFSSSTGYSLTRYLRLLKPGGIIILGKKLENAYTVKRVCDRISELHKRWRVPVPMFTSINQEGGSVNRLRGNTVLFPSAMALGAIGDPDVSYRAGRAIGRQLRAAGLNMNYAPVLDINTNPVNQVIGYRSFSDRFETVRRCASAFARGMKESGVIPVGKHFPGHGRTRLDSHWFFPRIKTAAAKLYATDFRMFGEFPRALLPSVMTAHVVYKRIDSVPATLSRKIITGYFRKKCGYNGVIMTDDIFMSALSKRYSYPDIVRRALLAGNDIISTSLPYRINSSLIRHIAGMVRKGVISRESLNRSVLRILRLKKEYGLFSRKAVPLSKAKTWLHGRKVRKTAAMCFRDAVTIMRDPKRILPLKKTGSVLIVSYKGSFNMRLRSLLLRKKISTRVRTLWIPYGSRAAHAWRVYRTAARFKTVVYAGGSKQDRKAVELLSRYRKKNIIVVSFVDPYWPGSIKGDFSYVATFSWFPQAVRAAAEKIVGLHPFVSKPPISVFR